MKKVNVTVEFEAAGLVAFKQEWMNEKVDGIESEVNTEINGTRLQIIINGKSYITDVADIANSLIEKVLTPQSDE